MLTKQAGLLVCNDHRCYDNQENERRQSRIAEVLSDGREGDDPKAEKMVEEDPFPELEF